MIYSKTDLYRIQIGDSIDYPYHVYHLEKGWFPSWRFDSLHSTVEKAKQKIADYKSSISRLPPKGTVITQYDEAEIIIDKLAGIIK